MLLVNKQFRINPDRTDHTHMIEDVIELVNSEFQAKNLGELWGILFLPRGMWSTERLGETIAGLRLYRSMQLLGASGVPRNFVRGGVNKFS